MRMQLTKIVGNGRLTNLVWPKSVYSSSFLKPLFHQRSLSEYSTLSSSHLWKMCSPNGVRVRGTIQSGAFPSSLLARRVFSNALLQGRRRFPVKHCNRRSFSSFPWSSFLRRLTTNGVVLGLIVTNAAVFILWRVAGIPFMVKNFTISVDNILSGRLHTLITNAFSHINQFHIISNMITLYFFGTAIGRYFGPQYLLKLYLAGALAGSIFYVAYKAFIAPLVHKNDKRGLPHSMDPALGASGATTAILLLYIFLFPKKTILIDFIIPVPAVLVGVLFIGKDILMVLQGDRDVAGSAHLGGAAVATVAWLQKRKGRFGRF
ncbi:RHOMBOID-like protein 12, mitochondrial isoform X1 [Salvia splendens]|nr:RHOMBOID-like protein 12, mitochondrial isoform X1 [Salvia splendens]